MSDVSVSYSEKIQEVLQPNQSAIEDDKTQFPALFFDPEQSGAVRAK